MVDEIVAAGGEAAANTDDVSSWDGARNLIAHAIETFGALNVLVNNAGILRDPDGLLDGRGGVGRRHQGPPQGEMFVPVHFASELLGGSPHRASSPSTTTNNGVASTEP